jgi:hypothetical protein
VSLTAEPSTASPAHPDAGLFALQPEVEAADHIEEQAHKALAVVEEAFFAAKPPKPERDVLAECKAILDKWDMEDAALLAGERPDAATRLAEFENYKMAHDAKVQAWMEECARLRTEFGVAAADDRSSEADAAVDNLGQMVAAIPATTLAGLVFKAKYALAHNESEADARVVESILDDLLGMAGKDG